MNINYYASASKPTLRKNISTFTPKTPKTTKNSHSLSKWKEIQS